MFDELEKLYDNDISKLDAYVGGMLETNTEGPGELFKTIILDQFLRLRDGDRFWFENIWNGSAIHFDYFSLTVTLYKLNN